MAKGTTCPLCQTYVSCPSCEGFICPGCGSDLPQDGGGPKVPMCAYKPTDNDNDDEWWG